MVVSVLAVGLILADVGISWVSLAMDLEGFVFSPTAWLLESASRAPGPLAVFSGNWAMIDV